MKKQTLSVGFTDLTHYAKAVETLGSEQALAFLQEAFQAAGDVIVQRGGRIRKYIGDAILFTFDDPQQAVCAAKEMAAGYCREVEALTLRWHVAVATGEVLVGEIGHPSFRVEDVMGETVNRAARLMKEAHQSESGCAFCEETRKYK
jgi:adenylate cyclase